MKLATDNIQKWGLLLAVLILLVLLLLYYWLIFVFNVPISNRTRPVSCHII